MYSIRTYRHDSTHSVSLAQVIEGHKKRTYASKPASSLTYLAHILDITIKRWARSYWQDCGVKGAAINGCPFGFASQSARNVTASRKCARSTNEPHAARHPEQRGQKQTLMDCRFRGQGCACARCVCGEGATRSTRAGTACHRRTEKRQGSCSSISHQPHPTNLLVSPPGSVGWRGIARLSFCLVPCCGGNIEFVFSAPPRCCQRVLAPCWPQRFHRLTCCWRVRLVLDTKLHFLQERENCFARLLALRYHSPYATLNCLSHDIKVWCPIDRRLEWPLLAGVLRPSGCRVEARTTEKTKGQRARLEGRPTGRCLTIHVRRICRPRKVVRQ